MTRPNRTCKVLYFAWVREKIGRPHDVLEIPPTVETVGDFIAWLKQKGGEYEIALEDESVIRVALDQKHATPKSQLGNSQEIALFPPVTGG